MSERKVYILIGLPGSGKSTKANQLVEPYAPWDSAIHSTDSFFMKNGKYEFNPKLLGVFHQKNFHAFESSLKKNLSCVVVDNTNIRPRDRRPYREAALAAGYSVEEIVIGEFTPEAIKLYAKRNTHGVPLEAIEKMAERFISSNKTKE